MYSASGSNITLTRGDTFKAKIDISINGNVYTPVEGDSIRFAMKANYADPAPLLNIDIPINTLKLVLNPDDTKSLEYGSYVYDIQLTHANGDIDTFIKGRLKLTEEVD